MLELLDGVSDETGVLETRKALGARPNVCLEGGNAKTLLVIEEEVDLSREKVTVIHGEVYALVRECVSERKTEKESLTGRPGEAAHSGLLRLSTAPADLESRARARSRSSRSHRHSSVFKCSKARLSSCRARWM